MEDKNKLVPYIKKKEIKTRIKEIAKEIQKEYKGKVPVFIGVLNGAFIFMSDLIREVNIDCEIDFYKFPATETRKYHQGM